MPVPRHPPGRQPFWKIFERISPPEPGSYFNNCLNPDELIGAYAAKWAHYSLEPVVIVIYNKAHKFYQSSEYSKDHAVFESVRRFREITELHNIFNDSVTNGRASYSDLERCSKKENVDMGTCSTDVMRLINLINSTDLINSSE